MIYVLAEHNRGFDGNMTHIDGYSKAKTERGALQDLARTVAKYSPAEAEGITDMIKYNEVTQIPASRWDAENKIDAYIIEWERVGCASKSNAKDESVTTEANWYLHIAFVQQ